MENQEKSGKIREKYNVHSSQGFEWQAITWVQGFYKDKLPAQSVGRDL